MDGLFVSRVEKSITELHGLQVKMAELCFNENRIPKAKLTVWLAIEEGVFSVELRLCMKRYFWRYWAIFRSSLLRNSSLHYVLNKILYNNKAFIGYRCFGAFWSVNNWPWPWLCTTDLASYLLTKWQFWQLTLKWLSGAPTQDNTKEFFSCFFFLFFQDFIQLCDSRKIHYLTRNSLVW